MFSSFKDVKWSANYSVEEFFDSLGVEVVEFKCGECSVNLIDDVCYFNLADTSDYQVDMLVKRKGDVIYRGLMPTTEKDLCMLLDLLGVNNPLDDTSFKSYYIDSFLKKGFEDEDGDLPF